jgi:SAM-dependent methyltransferase
MFKKYLNFLYKWLNQIIDPFFLLSAVPGYIRFFKQWFKYSRLDGAEKIKLIDTYPRIHDKTQITRYDKHYFYQNIWALKRIYQSKTDYHVDVGSSIDFIASLTVFTKVNFIDIRPLIAKLDNFDSQKGSILKMPFDNNSLMSLSCCHVAEHIGLGRYEDDLDPYGTKKACKELSRILAPGGKLYFSVPVGKQRLCFNAHRIHSPKQVLKFFDRLELIEFSGIDDEGVIWENLDMDRFEDYNYALGLYIFTKV